MNLMTVFWRVFDFLLFTPTISGRMLFIAGIVLFILAVTAFEDARTGRVPNVPLALGGVLSLFAAVFFEGQAFALQRAAISFFVLGGLWGLNELYYKTFNRDAFGLGDVKWSGLAAFIFGIKPLFWAWCLAAGLGVVWMAGRWVAGLVFPSLRGGDHVHFAPFLFLALAFVLFATSSGA